MSSITDLNSTGASNGNTMQPSSGITLPKDVLEHLYQSYSLKQKRAGLNCFLAASILFDLWAVFIPQGQSWESIGKQFMCLYTFNGTCINDISSTI